MPSMIGRDFNVLHAGVGVRLGLAAIALALIWGAVGLAVGSSG